MIAMIAAIDQHPEHQPLVHDRQDLAPLSDQTEPLGPCDESGRRGVHQCGAGCPWVCAWRVAPPADAAGAPPLALGLAPDKGASGSAVAVLTGFVAGGGFRWQACRPQRLPACRLRPAWRLRLGRAGSARRLSGHRIARDVHHLAERARGARRARRRCHRRWSPPARADAATGAEASTTGASIAGLLARA